MKSWTNIVSMFLKWTTHQASVPPPSAVTTPWGIWSISLDHGGILLLLWCKVSISSPHDLYCNFARMNISCTLCLLRLKQQSQWRESDERSSTPRWGRSLWWCLSLRRSVERLAPPKPTNVPPFSINESWERIILCWNTKWTWGFQFDYKLHYSHA